MTMHTIIKWIKRKTVKWLKKMKSKLIQMKINILTMSFVQFINTSI